MRPVLRFAPSPNGLLHLGHAYSALLNQRRAEKVDGRLLLRLEDIDVTRCRPEFEQAIFEDLAWIGFAWEEPVRRQSEHLEAYADALSRLDALGLIRRSVATRREIREAVAAAEATGQPWPRDPDGVPVFPGDEAILDQAQIMRRQSAEEPQALRLDMAAALARLGEAPRFREMDKTTEHEIVSDPAAWGDVVLARKETPTSYHLSVVVDDALQGVTEVVRGRDLLAATAIHRVLQDLLGLPAPAYRHHRLILDAEGRKLSKSAKDTGLSDLRATGVTPEEVRARIGLR